MQIKNCKFLRPLKINAIVIYPFVLYCDACPSEEIVRHEGVHLRQIQEEGVLRFYFQYLKEYLLNRKRGLNHHAAYRNISYEKEAYGDTSAS